MPWKCGLRMAHKSVTGASRLEIWYVSCIYTRSMRAMRGGVTHGFALAGHARNIGLTIKPRDLSIKGLRDAFQYALLCTTISFVCLLLRRLSPLLRTGLLPSIGTDSPAWSDVRTCL